MLMVEFLPILVTLVGGLILMSLASLWLGMSLLAWTLVYVGLSYVLARRAQNSPGCMPRRVALHPARSSTRSPISTTSAISPAAIMSSNTSIAS